MLRNETSGNAVVERMSNSFLDDKGQSPFSSISKALTYVLRNGLTAENQRGYDDWTLQTYGPDTGRADAREILSHRRASHAMKESAQHNEQCPAFVL